MKKGNKSRDLTWCLWLTGILIIVLFAFSLYLDRVNRDIQAEFMTLARNSIEENSILKSSYNFHEQVGNVSTVMQGVTIFLAIPFGIFLRLRYLEKSNEKNVP